MSIEERLQLIMKPFSQPWRWFLDGDWIVLEPPRGLIAASTMNYIDHCDGVYTVEAVFRSTPHAGIYLRFRMRDL